MTKVLSLETCKRLQDRWLLDDIETEYLYIYEFLEPNKYEIIKTDGYCTLNPIIKAPNLEEAIELLPKKLEFENIPVYLEIFPYKNLWCICYRYDKTIFDLLNDNQECQVWLWKTLLEAVEKMINYLLDNNLIWK